MGICKLIVMRHALITAFNYQPFRHYSCRGEAYFRCYLIKNLPSLQLNFHYSNRRNNFPITYSVLQRIPKTWGSVIMYNKSNRTNGAKDIITHIDLIKASYVKGVHFHAHHAATSDLRS